MAIMESNEPIYSGPASAWGAGIGAAVGAGVVFGAKASGKGFEDRVKKRGEGPTTAYNQKLENYNASLEKYKNSKKNTKQEERKRRSQASHNAEDIDSELESHNENKENVSKKYSKKTEKLNKKIQKTEDALDSHLSNIDNKLEKGSFHSRHLKGWKGIGAGATAAAGGFVVGGFGKPLLDRTMEE